MNNSLIAGNSAGGLGPDCKGTFLSAGFNLIGNSGGSIGFGSTGDQLNVNPLIGPLQDNGGPTFTHALLAGSPAIDKGGFSGQFADQRGRARPYDFPSSNASGGDGSDIGAFEFNPPVLSIARAANDVVVVSWSAYDTGYLLEAKSTLDPAVSWMVVPGTPPIVDGRYTFTGSPTGSTFFRIRSP